MKNSKYAGTGNLEQARLFVKNACWHLLNAPGAHIQTEEYALFHQLMDIAEGIEELKKNPGKVAEALKYHPLMKNMLKHQFAVADHSQVERRNGAATS